MSEEIKPLLFAGFLVVGGLLGRTLSRFMPQHFLSTETRDSMKLAFGSVATMPARMVGLRAKSAKTNYDGQRNTVIQLAAKISMLDRALAIYGSETNEARDQLRTATQEMVRNLWSEHQSTKPILTPEAQAGTAIYFAIHGLSPRDDIQRTLKTQALTLSAQIGELRAMLVAQSVTYISGPLLVVLIAWLVVVFLTFSVLAPRNLTAMTILIVSALSISGAMFLIIELNHPFGGLIRIPSEPLLQALMNASE